LDNVQCSIGFGQKESLTQYPNKNVLAELLNSDIDVQTIWNVVIISAILGDSYGLSKNASWAEKIQHYQKNHELLAHLLNDIDNELYAKNIKHIVLFDTLEYIADDWQKMKCLLKGLLQVALKFRAFRAIRLKLFLRPDMLEDTSIYSFPDSSKLINNIVSLEWTKLELFNLLWQYLGNAEQGGNEFRKICANHFGHYWKQHPEFGIWLIPEAMRKDETVQRNIFYALAGEWMGTNARRGFTYSWLPRNLSDNNKRVSPRSFLTALRVAAEDENVSREQLYPLRYQAIKKGVQEASKIRVNELNEAYPWLNILIKPLKGISVPCPFSMIQDLWEKSTIIPQLENIEADIRLPPSRLKLGHQGIKQDLIDLGVFEIMSDGRVNMPEVYRIAYGLGRKGGVPPVR
jgi:hypothetical protein